MEPSRADSRLSVSLGGLGFEWVLGGLGEMILVGGVSGSGY